jgi:hypothetical protein
MLNLLPPEEKNILKHEQKKRLLLVLYAEITMFLLCIFLVLSAVEFNIMGELVSQDFLLHQAQIEDQSFRALKFESEMVAYNQKLASVDSFYKNRVILSDAVHNLLKVVRPAGLYFTKFSVQPGLQPNKATVVIAGVSDTRESLLAFKNNIELEKTIENINFSPESWISQKNINFNLTLDIINGK